MYIAIFNDFKPSKVYLNRGSESTKLKVFALV